MKKIATFNGLRIDTLTINRFELLPWFICHIFYSNAVSSHFDIFCLYLFPLSLIWFFFLFGYVWREIISFVCIWGRPHHTFTASVYLNIEYAEQGFLILIYRRPKTKVFQSTNPSLVRLNTTLWICYIYGPIVFNMRFLRVWETQNKKPLHIFFVSSFILTKMLNLGKLLMLCTPTRVPAISSFYGCHQKLDLFGTCSSYVVVQQHISLLLTHPFFRHNGKCNEPKKVWKVL